MASTGDPGTIPTLFQNIGLNYKGKNISLMTVSPQGDYAAVAGKRGIFLVDLADPWELQSKIKLKAGLVEVHAIKWAKDPTQLASAHGASVLLWKMANDGKWSNSSQTVCHRRTVTDISWSRTDEGFFTTCASDGVCKAWDVRQPDKPAVLLKKLQDNVSPTRSRWSRHDAVKIATINGNQVLLWDLRKSESPFSRIFAATGEVTSLDWSHTNKTLLLTCSREHRFRIWSTDNPSDSVGGGIAAVPVDKGLFTPFGEGIMVAGKSNNLFQIFGAQDVSSPTKIGTYGGNGGAVADFWFRKALYQGQDEYQIVSWSSQDEQLRLFPIEAEHLEATGYRVTANQRARSASVSRSRAMAAGDKGAVIESNALAPGDPIEAAVMSMEEEFDNIRPIVGVTVAKMDKLNRTLLVDMRFSESDAPLLTIELTFPSMYPYQVAPAVAIIENDTDFDSFKIKEEITSLCDSFSRNDQNSIEACLKLAQTKFIQEPMLNSFLKPARAKTNELDGPSNSPPTRRAFSKASSALHEKLAQLGPGYELYLTKPSDTIAAIALVFGMDKAELRNLNGIHHFGQLPAGREIIVTKRAEAGPSPVIFEKTERKLPFNTLDRLKIERDGAPQPTETQGGAAPLTSPTVTALQSSGMTRSVSGANVGRLSLDPITSPRSTGQRMKLIDPLDKDSAAKRAQGSPKLSEKRTSTGSSSVQSSLPGDVASKPAVFKCKADLLIPEKSVSVSGQVTVTPTQLIFEPNLDDQNVKKSGLLRFTLVLDLQRIDGISRIRLPKASPDVGCLQIVTTEIQHTSGTKIVHLVSSETKISEISSRLEGPIKAKREFALMQSLHLDAVPMSPSKKRLDVRLVKSPPPTRNSPDVGGVGPRSLSSSDPAANTPSSTIDDGTSRLTVSEAGAAPTQSEGSLGGLGLGEVSLHGFGMVMSNGLGELGEDKGVNITGGLSELHAAYQADARDNSAYDEDEDDPKPTVAPSDDSSSQVKTTMLMPMSLPEDLLGRMLDKSFILDKDDFKMLRDLVPDMNKDKNWRRLFTTQVDGTSITTFFNKVLDYAPTVLLVKDTHGYVFGGYASEEWQSGIGFHGTGECFVFALKPKLAVYRWTEANDFFMIASKEFVAMGGGVSGRYALYIDGEFCWGTSEVSNTFLNRRLSSSEEFQCAVVEMWTLTTDSSDEEEDL